MTPLQIRSAFAIPRTLGLCSDPGVVASASLSAPVVIWLERESSEKNAQAELTPAQCGQVSRRVYVVGFALESLRPFGVRALKCLAMHPRGGSIGFAASGGSAPRENLWRSVAFCSRRAFPQVSSALGRGHSRRIGPSL